MKTGMAVTDKS